MDDVLEPALLPYLNARLGSVFQQDNTIARMTLKHLKAINVNVFSWHVRSPDLSPIEMCEGNDESQNTQSLTI